MAAPADITIKNLNGEWVLVSYHLFLDCLDFMVSGLID